MELVTLFFVGVTHVNPSVIRCDLITFKYAFKGTWVNTSWLPLNLRAFKTL